MTPSQRLIDTLKDHGIDFFVSVPCKLLDETICLLQADEDVIYTPVTREEEGMGILAGAHLAGRRPAIVMQNSGFGNSVNAICALLNYYRIPVVMVMSHRGSPGEPIDAQRPMGDAIVDLTRATGVDCHTVPSPNDLDIVAREVPRAREEERSVAFLFPFDYWKA